MLYLLCTLQTAGVKFVESRQHDDRGQTAAEYLGIVVVIAIIITALAKTKAGDEISKGISEKIAHILKLS